MSRGSTAILLMAYGSPTTLADVAAYYTHIRGGRPPSPEQVEELQGRYRAIGGTSPLLDITRAQAAALAARVGLPVYVGMKHWHPFIAETVGEMRAAGIARAAAIALAPHYSRMSIGGYMKSVAEAAARAGGPEFAYVESWHLHPRFLDALTTQVEEARRRLRDPDAVTVVFTAHSLPQRILAWGDPYMAQLQETAAAVAQAASITRWSIAFQSASATGEPWLGPDILEVLDDLHAGGAAEVVVCPAGFVADHLEVLYDLDVEARHHADARGLRLIRTRSLNAASAFIETLADIAAVALEKPSLLYN